MALNYERKRKGICNTFLYISILSHGRRQRGKGGNPRESEKLLLKNGVISEGSIFSNKFSKDKITNINSIFL